MRLRDLTVASVRDAARQRCDDVDVIESIGPLLAYAQHGTPTFDGLLSLVLRVLWSRPIDGRSEPAWSAVRAEPLADNPVRMVVVAAIARADLDAGRAIPANELALLGSVAAGGVRRDIAKGRLRASTVQRGRARVAMVAAEDARAWLARRGAACDCPADGHTLACVWR